MSAESRFAALRRSILLCGKPDDPIVRQPTGIVERVPASDLDTALAAGAVLLDSTDLYGLIWQEHDLLMDVVRDATDVHKALYETRRDLRVMWIGALISGAWGLVSVLCWVLELLL